MLRAGNGPRPVPIRALLLAALLLLTPLAATGIGAGSTGGPPPPPGSTYTFTAIETGLPQHFPWFIQINEGTTGSAQPVKVNGTTWTTQLSPGLYNVLVLPITNWQPTPTSGIVNIINKPVWFNVTFTLNNTTIPDQGDNNTTSRSPFALTPTLLAFLGVTGGVAAVAAFLVYRMRRNPRPKKKVETAPAKPKAKRKPEEDDEEDPEVAERRRARRERREGIRPGRGPARSAPKASDAPDSAREAEDDE